MVSGIGLDLEDH